MDLHTPPESVGSTDSLNGPIWNEAAGTQVGPGRNGDDRQPGYAGSRAEAMKSAEGAPGSPGDSTSEEDYDSQQPSPEAIQLRRRNMRPAADDLHLDTDDPAAGNPAHGGRHGKTFVVAADDTELRAVLKRGLEREEEKKHPKRREKFRDMVFTRQFSAFDRQNQEAANNTFHGFYTLFWIALVFLLVKMGAENWRKTGSPLGSNEIMKIMFGRDVIVLLASDGIMCALTGFGWILQRIVHAGYIDWNRSGWVIQNVWQTAFIGAVVGLTLVREWPWTHTVFFVLHGLVMLMKQHSYAFYNGHLSTVYKQREVLLEKLKQLEQISPVNSPMETNLAPSELSISHLEHRPSASEYKERRQSIHQGSLSDDIGKVSHAIDSGKPLILDQVQLFERMIKWEVDALTDTLRGRATNPALSYPNNLTLYNHYEYIVLPTLVYELEYPRSESIDWFYVLEKGTATFGLIFVMIMVSQAYIYPIVIHTAKMKEEGWSTRRKLQEFPWILSDLVFPFMMEYLLAWYLIWETLLNTLAELTYFADRSFYDAWWNSVSWDQFARDWNRPVHNFLLRHVYHSSISSMRVKKHTATLITFFLSALVHELVMWCIFKKLRGYLLMLQMSQLPLVSLSRTKWLRGKTTLGNIMFWVGIFTGPSLLCSLYLIV